MRTTEKPTHGHTHTLKGDTLRFVREHEYPLGVWAEYEGFCVCGAKGFRLVNCSSAMQWEDEYEIPFG